MTEDQIITRMVGFFEERGDTVEGTCFGTSAGVDIAVRMTSGQTLFVEAKGLTEGAIGIVQRPLRGRCQAIWDNGYARLPQLASGRKRVRLRDDTGESERCSIPDFVGLAVPDNSHIREHLEWFYRHMKHSGFGVWLVSDSEVDEVISPAAVGSDKQRDGCF